MIRFETVALGLPCAVEVAFIAQFKWADGTIEYMSDPVNEWKSFGITVEECERIFEAMVEHKALHDRYKAQCDEEWANYEADCRASNMEPYGVGWEPSVTFEQYLANQ